MPVDEYWLCVPASHVRPFVQTVRVVQSCPRCYCFPGVLPSVPEPPQVPATLPGCGPDAPPPFSAAPPSTSQASCSATPKPCLLPPTSDGRQEENVQSGLVSLGAFLISKVKTWLKKIFFLFVCLLRIFFSHYVMLAPIFVLIKRNVKLITRRVFYTNVKCHCCGLKLVDSKDFFKKWKVLTFINAKYMETKY